MAAISKKSSRSSKSKKKSPESDPIKEFWNGQAKTHGTSDLATAPDHHYRELEIQSILRAIGSMKHEDILDVGCGNGYTTRQIADAFPDATVSGIDFSPDMIQQAKATEQRDNLDFYEGDVLSLSRNEIGFARFDAVLSSRCLINLANWEEQKIGILEMRKMLKPDGHLILVENVQDGLDNLNHLRTSLGLDPIQPRWHNQLIPQAGLEKFFREIQGQLLTVEYVENIGNFYYLASRVLYAKICKDQGIEPDYNNPINAVASKMPTMGEHYACSPNFMFILRNEGGGGPWDNKRLSS